jgi:hypothetical protein
VLPVVNLQARIARKFPALAVAVRAVAAAVLERAWPHMYCGSILNDLQRGCPADDVVCTGTCRVCYVLVKLCVMCVEFWRVSSRSIQQCIAHTVGVGVHGCLCWLRGSGCELEYNKGVSWGGGRASTQKPCLAVAVEPWQ